MSNSVYFPSYTYGSDAYKAIPAICRPFGRNVLVLGGDKGHGRRRT